MSSEPNFYYWSIFCESFFSPLRKCIVCGLEAYNENDLQSFMKSKTAKYGYVNRCKKCQSTIASEQTKIRRRNNSFWAKFQSLYVRKGKKSRGHTFNLTWEYLEKLAEEQNYCCALTGILLKRKNLGGNRHYNAPSIDRIDNSRGYEVGNVRWTSQWANQARSDYGDEVFYKMCESGFNYNRKG